MKINKLDAHDRLQHLHTGSLDIGKYCQEIIDKQPFGNNPFYIFAHKRQIGLDERIGIYEDDFRCSLLDLTYVKKYTSLEQVPTDRLIWQPRLTKPKAQTNSMLFKAYPGKDEIKVIWMLPAEDLWGQYTKGNLTENKTVYESILFYQTNKERLEAKEEDDLSDEVISNIYASISKGTKRQKFELI